MRHLCHASSAYIVVTVTQTRESTTAGLKLPMAHVQQRVPQLACSCPWHMSNTLAHLLLGQGTLHVQLFAQYHALVCNLTQHNAVQDGAQAQAGLLNTARLWLPRMGAHLSQEAKEPGAARKALCVPGHARQLQGLETLGSICARQLWQRDYLAQRNLERGGVPWPFEGRAQPNSCALWLH
jgi:hypothetical protein